MSNIRKVICDNCGKESHDTSKEFGWINISLNDNFSPVGITISISTIKGYRRDTILAFDFCNVSCLIGYLKLDKIL